MEFVASNSSPPSDQRHGRRRRRLGPPAQPMADRIVRALHQRLFILHRSEDTATFFVLGATANVYAVTLSATPTCTCPDRTSPCKHILFVLIRALGVSHDHPCLRRRTLRPCHLSRFLSSPTLPDSLAGSALRRRFHQLFFQQSHRRDRANSTAVVAEFEEGTNCPVCLEEMGTEERVVACATCRNPIHEECLTKWKRSNGRRAVCCVICRARWRDRMGTAAAEEEKYLNLAAYVDEDVDDDHADNVSDMAGLCAG